MQHASEEQVQANGVQTTEKKRSSVTQRWLTAGIAIPIVLLFVWFGGWVAFAGLLLIVILITSELHNMLVNAGYHPLSWMSFGLSVLFLLAAMFPQHQLLILEASLGLILLVSFPVLFFRKSLDGTMVDWALTLAVSLYVGLPMSFFLQLRGPISSRIDIFHVAFNSPWLYLPRGVWWLLMVLLGVWGFDAAAFFSGRYFGKHKLAPSISPAKTWEGVLGGFVISIAAGLVLTVAQLGVAWYLAILLGILVGIAATYGDLAESLIKRQTRVKDSGQFMPGHGGMLDRMDSLLFAVVVVFIFAQIIGK